jgi:DNA polymerase
MWSDLAEVSSAVRVCEDCALSRGRTNAVPGDGNPSSNIMFIGEGPGFHEDAQGLPFVGQAGQLLNDLLAEIGLKREAVYITNVVKCRPPKNRDPQPDEIKECSKYLDRQIELIHPKVVVTLGRFSMDRFFPGQRISKVHGSARRIGRRTVLPMYHPAAALHQPSLRQTLSDDFAKILVAAETAQDTPVADDRDDTARQLSLF